DLTVNIMAGATEIDFVQEEGVDESQIEEAPDIPATFSAIEAGRADATTGTEMTVKMAYESADSENLEWVRISNNLILTVFQAMVLQHSTKTMMNSVKLITRHLLNLKKQINMMKFLKT